MTAEIALLNKEAVALAADSAVTIRTPGGTKILPSANKIFALSKYHPVGVMVFGNAQLLGAPWELLVKTYRKQLGKHRFPRLQDYADDFVKFLERAETFFPEETQHEHFLQIGNHVLNTVRQRIESALAVFLNENDTADFEDVRRIVRDIVTDFHAHLEQLQFQENISDEYIESVKQRHKDAILEGIDAVLERLVDTDDLRDLLVDSVVYWLCKAVPNTGEADSGLVIAGYGEDDVYPSLRSFHIEGIVANRLIYAPTLTHDVVSDGASIVPFAQIDVVHTFMEGVDERYQTLVEEAVREALQNFATAAAQGSGKKGEALRDFDATLSHLATEAGDQFAKLARTYRTDHFANPTLDVVSILPKDRLAAMAESLVDITALRRQFSMTEETVGGPIDVAVISKGDGLVWIKRKHYFEKALNPQFFHNYFQED
jgi:hypothetical protein